MYKFGFKDFPNIYIPFQNEVKNEKLNIVNASDNILTIQINRKLDKVENKIENFEQINSKSKNLMNKLKIFHFLLTFVKIVVRLLLTRRKDSLI